MQLGLGHKAGLNQIRKLALDAALPQVQLSYDLTQIEAPVGLAEQQDEQLPSRRREEGFEEESHNGF